MDQAMVDKLRVSLTKHEGRTNKLYTDTMGKASGAIGYNFTDRGVPDWFIDKQFLDDISFFYQKWWDSFEWYKDLSVDRQIVLIDMSFMGFQRILEFTTMLSCLGRQDYAGAAEAMLDSAWARQVGKRSTDLADGMRTGVYNP